MALNDQECESVFQEVFGMIRQLNLEWVQIQVTEQVKIGITEEKQLLTVTASSGNRVAGKSKRRTKVTFASKRPYTSREKLLLLVDAIEQAVVNPAQMESEIAGYFTAKGGVEVVLHRDRSDGTQSVTRIDATSAASRLQGSATLERLLLELRKEI